MRSSSTIKDGAAPSAAGASPGMRPALFDAPALGHGHLARGQIDDDLVGQDPGRAGNHVDRRPARARSRRRPWSPWPSQDAPWRSDAGPRVSNRARSATRPSSMRACSARRRRVRAKPRRGSPCRPSPVGGRRTRPPGSCPWSSWRIRHRSRQATTPLEAWCEFAWGPPCSAASCQAAAARRNARRRTSVFRAPKPLDRGRYARQPAGSSPGQTANEAVPCIEFPANRRRRKPTSAAALPPRSRSSSTSSPSSSARS